MSQYSAMPPAPSYGGPPARGPAPSTVVNAVRIMVALAALAAVGIVVLFAQKDELRDAIRNNNNSYTTKQIDDAVTIGVSVAAVIFAILIVLYVLLALQVRKGKNWARIVTWVFSGLFALSALSNLTGTEATLTKVISGIDLVLYIVLIVLLAMRPSNDYFRKPGMY